MDQNLDLFDLTNYAATGVPTPPGTLVAGPFAVDHDDASFVATLLTPEGDEGLAFYDPRVSGFRYFDSYLLTDSGIEVSSDEDKYLIRPLIESDLAELNLTSVSLDEAKVVLFKRVHPGVRLPVPEYALTLDQTGKVIGLFLRRAEGGILRRYNGTWEGPLTEDDDLSDIEDLHWVSVMSPAIPIYDTLDTEDEVSVEALRGLAV